MSLRVALLLSVLFAAVNMGLLHWSDRQDRLIAGAIVQGLMLVSTAIAWKVITRRAEKRTARNILRDISEPPRVIGRDQLAWTATRHRLHEDRGQTAIAPSRAHRQR
jgi:hypothetical protein